MEPENIPGTYPGSLLVLWETAFGQSQNLGQGLCLPQLCQAAARPSQHSLRCRAAGRGAPVGEGQFPAGTLFVGSWGWYRAELAPAGRNLESPAAWPGSPVWAPREQQTGQAELRAPPAGLRTGPVPRAGLGHHRVRLLVWVYLKHGDNWQICPAAPAAGPAAARRSNDQRAATLTEWA